VPKVVDADAQRARIRRAARRVAARRGLAGTGLARVAAEAGISRPSLYHYYADKDALVRDVARELLAEEARLFEQALLVPGPVFERIERLADAVLARFAEWADSGRALLEVWCQDVGRLRPLLRRLRRALAGLIDEGQRRGEIEAALRPDETAAILVGLIDGLMLQVLLDPQGIPATPAMREALASGLRGILHVEESS
jgi:TetR/AcrR family fatty acid metabolism transcriptional regulator